MEYWEAVYVFEKISASKFEAAAAGRRIPQTIYFTADERRDNLDLNQIREACNKKQKKSLHAASQITAESLSGLSSRCSSGWVQARNPAGYG